jgi:hypothetical protein
MKIFWNVRIHPISPPEFSLWIAYDDRRQWNGNIERFKNGKWRHHPAAAILSKNVIPTLSLLFQTSDIGMN